jgi:site-specific recombinase XerD
MTGEELDRFAFFLRYPPDARRGRRRPKGEATIAAYLWTVRRFHRFLAGREVSQEAAEDFVRHLETAGNSPRTIGRHIYALQAYFAFKGQELELGAPAFTRRLPRWLTDEEWRRLLEHAERPLWDTKSPERAKVRALFHRAALFVYGGAGLRLSEGLGLHREDVDPRGYLRVLGKGGEEQIVPVEDAVVTAIQEWVVTHDSPWVFPSSRKKGGAPGHLDRRTMQAVVRDLMLGAGVKDVRRPVHTLRHTVGADLRMRGADLRDIQQVLRHSDISTTTIYTQMANEELRKKLPKRFR